MVFSRREREYLEVLDEIKKGIVAGKTYDWLEQQLFEQFSPEYRIVLRSRIKKKVRQMEKDLELARGILWMVEKYGRK